MSTPRPARVRPPQMEPPTDYAVSWPMVAAGGLTLFVAAALFGCLALLVGPRPAPGAGEKGRKRTERAETTAVPRVSVVRFVPFLAPEKESPPAAVPEPTKVAAAPRPQPRPAVTKPVTVVAVAPPAPPPEPQAPAAEPAVPVRAAPKWSEDALLSMLYRVPEVDLEAEKGASAKVLQAANEPRNGTDRGKDGPPDNKALFDLLAGRADLAGLPAQKGAECLTPAKTAKTTQDVSQHLRRERLRLRGRSGTFSRSEVESDARATAAAVDRLKGLVSEDTAHVLVQMLEAENEPVRQAMLRAVAAVKGPRAGTLLARRAAFDTSAAVRAAAVEALKGRPPAEYRPALLDALRYPWAPAADHAAEALVALGDRDAVPELAALLDEPDPQAPYRDAGGQWFVPELVRVNHLRNCLLCHAPSSDPNKDLVRGMVPTPGQPLPEAYYESRGGTFIRADVTYLRQDFSAVQMVDYAAPWPTFQRFDYLVRARKLTDQEVADRGLEYWNSTYPQREAVLHALRELSGRDAGATSAEWQTALWDFKISEREEP